MKQKPLTALLGAVLALLFAAPGAHAQPMGGMMGQGQAPPPAATDPDASSGQYGWGRMGPGVGQGWGMGPGWGMMGPGMMGQGGWGTMGPGMMGQGGWGMMGPGMMGPGMGFGPLGMLNLTEDQIKKVRAIQTDLDKRNRRLLNQIADEHDKLRDLYAADTPDPKAVGKVYSGIFDLRRQMVEAEVEAMNKMHGLLTKEQREQLSRMRQYGYGPMWMHGY